MNSKLYKNILYLCLGSIFAYFHCAAADPIDRIIVIVNDDVITHNELKSRIKVVQRQFQQRDAQLALSPTLEKQILDDLIQNKLQVQLANAIGIRVDNEMLNSAINNIAKQNDMDASQFRDALEKDGYSYAHFRNDIHDEIAIAQLRRHQIESRITVTDNEIDHFLANEKIQGNTDIEVHLAHILISLTADMTTAEQEKKELLAKRIHADASQGKDFAALARRYSESATAVQGGDLGWRRINAVPSLFTTDIATMAAGDIGKLKKDQSGFHIIKMIETRADKPVLLEQAQIRHILIKSNQLITDKEAKKKLQDLKWRIEQGDDFSTLAKAYSEDTSSALEGGDLGWLELRKLPPALKKAITTLKEQQISTPFKDDSGWHIAQLLARRQYDSTESVKRERAYEMIYKRKRNETLQEWLKKIRDEAYIQYLPE